MSATSGQMIARNHGGMCWSRLQIKPFVAPVRIVHKLGLFVGDTRANTQAFIWTAISPQRNALCHSTCLHRHADVKPDV